MRVSLSAAVEYQRRESRQALQRSVFHPSSLVAIRGSSACGEAFSNRACDNSRLRSGSKKQNRRKGIGHVLRKEHEVKLVPKNADGHAIGLDIFKFSLCLNPPNSDVD